MRLGSDRFDASLRLNRILWARKSRIRLVPSVFSFISWGLNMKENSILLILTVVNPVVTYVSQR